MKRVVFSMSVLLLFLSFKSGHAQELNLDDLIPRVEEWLQENVDDDIHRALTGNVDQERLQKFFADLQHRLASTSIYDLATLHETAQRLVPTLNAFEETKPYGAWLETHLDYLAVADQLAREAVVPPSQSPQPPPRRAPSPERKRKAWAQQLSQRGMPPRAAAMVPRLKEIFTAERLPAELVWVAEVESSFNPQARSPAGAAGLFQLMPQTARSLKLSPAPKDERLDPDKNAHAAARYLRYLHTRFGDWPLALAAYNAGPTRVEMLLQKPGTKTFDDIASKLPAETQMYVPKVIATVARREGRTLESLKMTKG